jgi:hypothetical protein
MGLAVGFIGGAAILEWSPLAALVELPLVAAVAARSPRLSGLGGALVGHGAVWMLLFILSPVSCANSCHYLLQYGPAHLADTNIDAWMAETRAWMAASAGICLAGLAVSAATATRIWWQRG